MFKGEKIRDSDKWRGRRGLCGLRVKESGGGSRFDAQVPGVALSTKGAHF